MSTALWTTQFGVESSYGGAVTTTKLIEAISITPQVNVERQVITPVGHKYGRILGSTRKWFTASYDGVADAHALPYILSSLLTTVTPIKKEGSTSVYTWDFFPAPTGAATFTSYTLNCGYGTNAVEATGSVFSSLTMDFSRRRGEFSVSGDIIGQKAVSTTMDSGATIVEAKPFLVSDMDIYMADTYAGLSSGKLTNVLSGSLSITDRYTDVWYVDSTLDGFSKVVEAQAPVSLSLMFEATADNLATLDDLLAGTREFIQVDVKGAAFEGTSQYEFLFEGAFELSGVDKFADSDGVYAFNINFAGVQDDTLDTSGGVFRIKVITDFGTL